MSGHEQLPSGYDLEIDDIPSDLSLISTYLEFIARLQATAWLACFEAWRACQDEMPKACERQGVDAAYELALSRQCLAGWQPAASSQGLEILETLFEELATSDERFASLYRRYEDLEEQFASLSEAQIRARRRAGAGSRLPIRRRLGEWLRGLGETLSGMSSG